MVERRRKQRAKVIELTRLILNTETDGIRADELQKLICDAVRFRASVHRIAKLISPLVETGEIERSLTRSGHVFYKMAKPFEEETETS